MDQLQCYDYTYIDNTGFSHSGAIMHVNDNEAISHFLGMEMGGKMKVKSLKNSQGKSIWRYSTYRERTIYINL